MTELEKAVTLLNEYGLAEFEHPIVSVDTLLNEVNVAYTTDEDTDEDIQVFVDLVNFTVTKLVGGTKEVIHNYDSLTELISSELEGMTFEDFIYM